MKMNRKVCIIGAGNVGATVAYTLAAQSIASEIVLIDINKKKAHGEALDVRQGVFFTSPCMIYDGEYEDAADADIVIITSGAARKPGMSRIDLAQTNVNIMKSVIPAVTAAAPNAIYIIVSNPVDILTYQFIKTSGIPENHVIGSGTMLDTARLRTALSDHFHINQRNVHAYVFGEHGDSSFVPWSSANISNIHVDDYGKSLTGGIEGYPPINKAELEEYVKKSGSIIIENKGATFYAVSLSVANMCKCIFSRQSHTMTVSSMMHGEYGIEDVCLSTLCIVNDSGVAARLNLELSPDELEKIRFSADKLKSVIASVQF